MSFSSISRKRGESSLSFYLKRAAPALFFFCLCLSSPYFSAEAGAEKSAASADQSLEWLLKIGPVPEFDRKNPQARGVVVAFKQYPASEIDQDRLIKKMKGWGLEKSEEFPLFKSWVFKWEGWRAGSEAQKICEDLSGTVFLEDCDPDLLTGPATGLIRKKVRKKADKAIERATGAANGPRRRD